MLTDIKHMQNKLCLSTEKEAETDAQRYRKVKED
jgi:hypothetical protein